MKKAVALMLGLTLAVGSLAGCGSNTEDTQAQTDAQTEAASENEETEAAGGEEASGDALKVALCLTGAKNDMGWCQSAYEGLELIKEEFGCEVECTENVQAADMVATFTDYAANGYDVVIGHGFQFGDPAVEVGELYPDTKFICIEAEASAENVASYVMKCEETAYLQGILAASMSESGSLGMIGPVQGASLLKIVNGYEDGAKSVNPDINYQVAWTNSYTDTAIAQEAAQAMIDQGADVIGHCANECGTGAINAAADAGIYATGDSYDQSSLGPNTILTSAVYNVPQLIEAAIQDIINGEFEGTVKQLGMAEGIVELVYNPDMESEIPEDVRQLVDDTAASIKSGEFTVPCDTSDRQAN